MTTVAADLRWPAGTGIGVVQREILRRCPACISVVDLHARGRIGSPLSPLRVAGALHHRRDAQVFWSPGYMPPLMSRIPVVVTVHDLTHLHYYSKFHALYYSLVLRRLYRRCARIISGSEFARNEFLQWSGIEPERVVVIHHGLSEKFLAVRPLTNASGAYVLYPGNRRAYKNLHRLIEAYSGSLLPGAGVSLLLTGTEDAATRDFAERHGVASHVRFAGVLDEAGLLNAYKGALAVAFVSLYEGFGLPVIEAMGSGVPVLCANSTSLPEVAGNAALLVNPYSVADIARGLEQVSFDSALRAQLIAAGNQRARQFNWDRTAALTWRVVEEAAARSGRTGGAGESNQD